MHHWISVVCGPKFTKFFSLNVEVVVVEGVFFSDFRYVDPFRSYSRSKSDFAKIDRILHVFWPAIFLGGRPPRILEWDYKIQPDSDHVAKFQGDRSRDLGERVAKKRRRKHLR